MPAFADHELVVVRDLRTDVAESLCGRPKRSQDIELRNDCRGLADTAGLFRDAVADFLEKNLFDLENLLLRRENLFFILLQFWSRKTLGADQGLLPVVVLRDQMHIGL